MKTHYFTKTPQVEFRPAKIKIRFRGAEMELYTSSGVFSPKKLDNGTKLLIENATVEKGWTVLDLGCGYGAVGVVLKKNEPSIKLWMSDVNPYAVKLAAMNLRLHGVEAETVESDCFSDRSLDAEMFDTILLNPPQSAGKAVCHRLIEGAYSHLKKDGLLQIVARHKKGGEQLSKKMRELFGNVTETAKGSGYRIYSSTRP